MGPCNHGVGFGDADSVCRACDCVSWLHHFVARPNYGENEEQLCILFIRRIKEAVFGPRA